MYLTVAKVLGDASLSHRMRQAVALFDAQNLLACAVADVSVALNLTHEVKTVTM